MKCSVEGLSYFFQSERMLNVNKNENFIHIKFVSAKRKSSSLMHS